MAETGVAMAAARSEMRRGCSPGMIDSAARTTAPSPRRSRRSPASWTTRRTSPRRRSMSRRASPDACATGATRDRAAGRTLDGPHRADLVVQASRRRTMPAARSLDRRAEGAADRAHPGPCPAVARDDRHGADPAARRDRRPSRCRPARRAVRPSSRRSAGQAFMTGTERSAVCQRWRAGRSS